MNTFFIVDIGSNHRGNIELAKKQIEIARETKCDAVKFQLFSHRELFGYDGATIGMPKEWVPNLKEHADKVGIEFMCTAFSPEGVEYVDTYVNRHKIASAEFKHPGIWGAILDTGKPVIASTGCAHGTEIGNCLKWINPDTDLTLLECVAAYPAEPGDYRLFALPQWLNLEFKVGISDHTVTNDIARLATDFGATVFEKHFDALSDLGQTPDSPVSITPSAMNAYIEAVKMRQTQTKDSVKRPLRIEDEMQLKHRRRIMAIKDIAKYEKLEFDVNFGIYRSKKIDYRGAPPELWQRFIGAMAQKDIKQGDSIWIDDVS
jgi:N,N'-diacetyllegionaminate synthase